MALCCDRIASTYRGSIEYVALFPYDRRQQPKQQRVRRQVLLEGHLLASGAHLGVHPLDDEHQLRGSAPFEQLLIEPLSYPSEGDRKLGARDLGANLLAVLKEHSDPPLHTVGQPLQRLGVVHDLAVVEAFDALLIDGQERLRALPGPDLRQGL